MINICYITNLFKGHRHHAGLRHKFIYQCNVIVRVDIFDVDFPINGNIGEGFDQHSIHITVMLLGLNQHYVNIITCHKFIAQYTVEWKIVSQML